jgi:hypothetical protein
LPIFGFLIRDSSPKKIFLILDHKKLYWQGMKLSSQNIDNLGLVAGMCDEIDLATIF